MYGKLFVQMYDGTLGTKGPWEALVTFQQLVILADAHGNVDMTAEAIARRTTIPLEVIKTGLQGLTEPDPDSRTPDEEGRRIVPIDESRTWGWRVVNYDHYRKIRSEEERREYHKQYMRKRRSVNDSVKVSTDGDQCSPKQYAVSSKQEALNTLVGKPPAANGKDNSEILEKLPLRGGGEFAIRQSFVAELEPLCPAVDIPATVKEMKLWLLGNTERLKTPRGIKRFITRWLQEEQNKHGS